MKQRLTEFGTWLKQRLRLNAIGGAFAGALACMANCADVNIQTSISEYVRSHLTLVITVVCLYAAAELVREYLSKKKCKSAVWDAFVWMDVGTATAALFSGLLGIMAFFTMLWMILIAAIGVVFIYKLDTAGEEESTNSSK